jgi:hypothetical protein
MRYLPSLLTTLVFSATSEICANENDGFFTIKRSSYGTQDLNEYFVKTIDNQLNGDHVRLIDNVGEEYYFSLDQLDNESRAKIKTKLPIKIGVGVIKVINYRKNKTNKSADRDDISYVNHEAIEIYINKIPRVTTNFANYPMPLINRGFVLTEQNHSQFIFILEKFISLCSEIKNSNLEVSIGDKDFTPDIKVFETMPIINFKVSFDRPTLEISLIHDVFSISEIELDDAIQILDFLKKNNWQEIKEMAINELPKSAFVEIKDYTFHNFKNLSGQPLVARIVSKSQDSVIIETMNEKRFNLKTASLSDESQKIISKWKPVKVRNTWKDGYLDEKDNVRNLFYIENHHHPININDEKSANDVIEYLKYAIKYTQSDKFAAGLIYSECIHIYQKSSKDGSGILIQIKEEKKENGDLENRFYWEIQKRFMFGESYTLKGFTVSECYALIDYLSSYNWQQSYRERDALIKISSSSK